MEQIRLRKVKCALIVLAMLGAASSVADSMSSVGDLSMATLDDTAQQTLASNGVLGVNQTDTATTAKCASDVNKATTDAEKKMATSLTPRNPVQTLNDSMKTCLDTVQKIQKETGDLEFIQTLGSAVSISGLFQTVLQNIVSQILTQVTQSAMDAWNKAVSNAIDTINTGINQASDTAFGNFVGNLGAAPAIPAAVPALPAPLKQPSAVPGL